jgi:hypothetical protein
MTRRGIGKKLALSVALLAPLALGWAPAASAQDPGQVGSWSALQQYPVVPVSMGVMPDGKIVAWDQANSPPNFPNIPNNGAAMVLDPATGSITRSVNVAPRTTFCSLIASLPDGRLAVIGGGSDSGNGAIPDVQIYDADSRTFSVAGQMNSKRWYPGGTLDRDGNPIVAGGSSQGIERFDAFSGTSTMRNSSFPANWYPDLIRTADGKFVIEDVGDNAAQGPGRYLLSGTTLSSISNTSNLKARLRGVRTLIGPHTMFYNGGGTSKESMIIDASGASPTYTRVADSRFHHMTGQALTLPTGDVLAVGGNSSGHTTKGTPVMTPEIYSPASNTWTSMADTARRRTYHSVAALLPDGRVWSAGSSFDEVQEPNGQFFSPPYLYRKDGSGQLAPRPTATDAPSSVAAGQSFSVATSDPSNIAHASFIRLAATTHQVNAGQSFVKLPVTVDADRVRMTAPSIDAAPPGYYMLFLVDKQGVPSVAPIMRFDKVAGTPPQASATQSSQFDRSTPAANAFDGDSSQGTGSKFSRTASQAEPWWQVDLGATRDLESVTVRFRTDCCSAQNRDLWVFASATPFSSTSVSGLRAQPGVSAVRLETPAGDVNTAALDRSARYLRVQSPVSGSLALVEVTPNVAAANQPPAIAITDPPGGSTFAAPATFRVLTDNSDADGTVEKVEFFRNGTLHKTDTNPPFSAGVYDLGAGEYAFTARATDDEGAQTTSDPVSVRVRSTNAAPAISITSPASGARFAAPADFRILTDNSDSDGTVQKVEFFRNSTLFKTDTSPPFSGGVRNLGSGSYTFTARATDDGGAQTTSDPVTVTVGSNAAPSISITSPADGAAFAAPATFRVLTDNSDADGTVEKVEFFRNGTLHKTDTNPPFSAGVYDLGAGEYAFTARATDDEGAQTTSDPVSVRVMSSRRRSASTAALLPF